MRGLARRDRFAREGKSVPDDKSDAHKLQNFGQYFKFIAEVQRLFILALDSQHGRDDAILLELDIPVPDTVKEVDPRFGLHFLGEIFRFRLRNAVV